MNLFRSSQTLVFIGLLLLGCTHPQPYPPQTSASGIQHPSVVAQHPTNNISNADIQWDGNMAGLWPTITGPSKAFLTNSDPRIVAALIESLTDKNDTSHE